MHRVTYSIRQIAAAELPVVRDPDGTERPAAQQELLNLGIVQVDGDLYSCVAQQRRDPDTLAWASHGQPLPGAALSEGSLVDRHARLPAAVRARVLRSRVVRTDAKGARTTLTIPMQAVRPTDEVEAELLVPHRWHGESPR